MIQGLSPEGLSNVVDIIPYRSSRIDDISMIILNMQESIPISSNGGAGLTC